MINDLKQRAYEQERSENFGQAIELYESVIDHREAEGLTHQDASVFLRIADLHLRRDQDEDAIGAFQRAGELYAREGLQPQAIAVYRRILRIAPEHTEALWNLAWLHAEMGVMAEARDYVGDYLRTVDMERDWVEARDFLRRLLDLSEDVAIGLRLAELLEEAGRHEEALEVLERLDVDFGAASALDEEEVRARIEALREEAVPEDEQVEDEVSFESADGDFAEDAAGDEFTAAGSEPEDAPPEFGDFEEEASGFDDFDDGAGEVADDEEYDLEVGGEEAGSFDEGFPFPDADDELENGTLDDGSLDDGGLGDDAAAAHEAAGDARDAAEDARDADEDAESEYSWNEPGESVDDEVERPPASFEDESFEDEVSAADEDEWETDEPEERWDEDREEDEEEPMSTRSQDLPVGRETGDTTDYDSENETDYETDYEEEYGEKAELRRGLDVLDELIELDPDRLDHYRRRVGYAERLDDADALVDSYDQMATALRRRDSSRGARLLYEHVLGLDVDAERARQGIEELDRRAREELDVPDLLPDADARSGPEADRSELGQWIWPELDRVRDEVQWLQGAAEKLRSDDRSGAGDGPPAEAYELAGRYFLARGEVDDAIDVLSLALEREDLSDDELVDVLFQLGLSHYRIDDRGSARRYFERVASHDGDFGTVCDWVLS